MDVSRRSFMGLLGASALTPMLLPMPKRERTVAEALEIAADSPFSVVRYTGNNRPAVVELGMIPDVVLLKKAPHATWHFKREPQFFQIAA